MSLGSYGREASFQDSIQGTVGEFKTQAGRVQYLMTKARLGKPGSDAEYRLTRNLVPVREVIPPENLDFNQLLQRDLDDHRVATSLVPYLLEPKQNGPAFFPPIVAVMLPFTNQEPTAFPSLTGPKVNPDDGLTWSEVQAGQALRIRRLSDTAGVAAKISLGELAWNNEFCRPVVVDGQHRAMALLAIDRTSRNAWQGSSGSQFKYFYESRIKESLGNPPREMDDLEVPVTLLWFPDMFGENKEPHKAARKLFVDVNKEARTPSESRLILLSDSQLINIFVRTALTELRNTADSGYMPLYCVEYDNPDTKTTQSARWSALTNIHAIKQMMLRSVFGPPKYINDLTASIGRRESEDLKDTMMRSQLRLADLFQYAVSESDGFPRDEIGNENFTPEIADILAVEFGKTWGAAILTLLSKIEPYAAHARALTQLKNAWLTDDAYTRLAHDALFGGVGMYWTLRDSAEHWRSGEGASRVGMQVPDIVKAWDNIVERQKDFEALRAYEYLGSKSRVEHANQLFQSMNTHACQLGLALTLASVNKFAVKKDVSVLDLANAVVQTANSWFGSRTSGDYDSRLVLSKRGPHSPASPFNLIANMDMPRAVQFRYFWLEILSGVGVSEFISEYVDRTELLSLRDIARRVYVDYIASEKERALKTSDPDLSLDDRKIRAVEDSISEVRSALKWWFSFSKAELDQWFANADVQADGLAEETLAAGEGLSSAEVSDLNGPEDIDPG